MSELKKALVWNFEDDNFTWMDAAVAVDGVLEQTPCMHYGFEPGWMVRWQDFGDVTWDDLENGTDQWSLLAGRPAQWNDLYKAGKERDMYWLTGAAVWAADRVVDKSGVKSYYAERTDIDFDDILGTTSNNYKHVRQVFPLLQSPSSSVAPNTYTFQIGWGNNLMDDPDYQDPVLVNLLKTTQNGKHKIDVRSTGRYMAMRWDFSLTDEFNMTGADVDIEESHGR